MGRSDEVEISVLYNLGCGAHDILEAYEIMSDLFMGDETTLEVLNEIKANRQLFVDRITEALSARNETPPTESEGIVSYRLLRNLRSAAVKRMKLAALGCLVDCEEDMTRLYLIQLDFKVSEEIAKLVDAQVERTIADYNRLSEMLRLASTPAS